MSLGVDELPGRLRSEIWLTLRTQGPLKRRGWGPEGTRLGAEHSSLPPPGGRTSPGEEKPVSGPASRPGYPGWAVSPQRASSKAWMEVSPKAPQTPKSFL